MVLIAGLQPDAGVQLGAMGVLFATHALAFMLTSGFGTALATRTSNELGAGDWLAAKRATWVGAVLAAMLGVASSVVLVVWARPWARIYNSDAAVVEVVTQAMPYTALSVASDSLNASLSGVLRGSGQQLLGCMVNLGTFWALGIPLAAVLDLRWGWGASGVWVALAGVSLLQALVLIAVVCSFGWERLAKQAQQNAASGQVPPLAAQPDLHHHAIYEPLLAAPHA
ncbi:mate-domain-containing protein [Haematococcus lacustris]